MSMAIDVKYVSLLSPQLNLFKVKQNNPYLATFRCVFCGDSQRNKFKTRGYFYQKKGGIFFKCHNCAKGTNLGVVIEHLDPALYQQYRFERYRDGLDLTKGTSMHSKPTLPVFEKPIFNIPDSVLDQLMTRVDKLPSDHFCVQYCQQRMLPPERYKELYFIEHIADIEQLSPKYKDRITGSDPRLVIPIHNLKGQLVAVTCRALVEDVLRYVTVVLNEDEPLVFNVDRIDRNEKIRVVEGPLDSMFLPNCCAALTSDLKKVNYYFPFNDKVYIFDNQPRNREIVKLMSSCVRDGLDVCVWPTYIAQKDINEMVKDGGLSIKEIIDIIDTNTYRGAAAALAINNWKRI